MQDLQDLSYEKTISTKLFRGAAQNAISTAVAGIIDFNDLGQHQVAKIPVTTIDQEDANGDPDPWDRFDYGNITAGDAQLTLHFDEDQFEELLAEIGVKQWWEIRTKKGTKIQFPGAITKHGAASQAGQKLQVPVTINIGAKPTIVKSAAGLPTSMETVVTKTGSYNGTSADLGASFAPGGVGKGMAAVLDITAIDNTTTDESYVGVLQQSSDNATFTACGPAITLNKVVGKQQLPGYVTQRYIRAALTLGGTSPSITYATTLKQL